MERGQDTRAQQRAQTERKPRQRYFSSPPDRRRVALAILLFLVIGSLFHTRNNDDDRCVAIYTTLVNLNV